MLKAQPPVIFCNTGACYLRQLLEFKITRRYNLESPPGTCDSAAGETFPSGLRDDARVLPLSFMEG